MKLPMLFKSLFETDSTPAAPPLPIVEAEREPEPVIPAPIAAKVQPLRVEQRAEVPHDPLLDSIDTLGDIVLALDAQLRAERMTNTALHSRLNGELNALRNVLR
ncbi:hypothetical protein [Paraburkholderia acidisoli]|uniref:Uncharacterized protein n=1 Tax=Paraburkholderia acidisoli TaxID=2571748 RepID=A0A7Z2JHZ1_9BURK|nr:hypothetical protein [Paraburkholderia acidisoli]QGZ63770.1 hypothetical protein FAZ98_18590 [Paraburkholderia acidisoli]